MSEAGPSVAPADPSWWLQEALAAEGDIPPAPPLAGEIQADVAIVGGGYTGLWTALALRARAPQLSVALIEATICGAGASGKNGAKVHGYWGALPGLVSALGDDGAVAVARAGAKAQDGIRAFARDCGRDVWWREAGHIKVSAAPAQDAKIPALIAAARRLGVAEEAVPLSPEEVQARCASPVFRAGVYLREGATVHPARLARALREAALRQGVRIFENTRMTGLDAGPPARIHTPQGQVVAREVVLATNVALAARPEVAPHMTVFSSYALMTEPCPERLAAIWPGEEGMADARMFIHYFRKTPDGRVLMGSGSGPIARGAAYESPTMTTDRASAARAEAGLRRLLPGLGDVAVAKAWGGAIDIAADRLPFFGNVPGTRIHYGCGYSGHGVNPTWIGGQCLASLVLGATDEWSALPLCTRRVPRLPPEPLRYLGGNAIRWAVMSCEQEEELGRSGPALARGVAALPRLLGLRIGTR